jgi:multiple sugar transport system ATP-binding protein
MSTVAVERLRKSFGKNIALDGISFDVRHGEFFCIVGRTNAGKTTLLKTIAGLYRPDEGRVCIGERDVTFQLPSNRRVSLLFQNIALFPTMSGFENVAFPLRTQKLPDDKIRDRVRAVAKTLKVDHIIDRLPRTYSGGEQQRVAIGRAIVDPGDVLMLDEPLSNLDAGIRIRLRIEFKKIHRELDQTIIYVTHDQVEAMSLSDRVAVLDRGRIQQIGSPDDVYDRPLNRFVAEFIGSPPMNIIDARLSETAGRISLTGLGFDLPVDPRTSQYWSGVATSREVAFGVRPERVIVASELTPETPLNAALLWVEHLGNRSILALKIGETTLKAVVPPDSATLFDRGDRSVWIGMKPEPHHLLNRDTGMFFQCAI